MRKHGLTQEDFDILSREEKIASVKQFRSLSSSDWAKIFAKHKIDVTARRLAKEERERDREAEENKRMEVEELQAMIEKEGAAMSDEAHAKLSAQVLSVTQLVHLAGWLEVLHLEHHACTQRNPM